MCSFIKGLDILKAIAVINALNLCFYNGDINCFAMHGVQSSQFHFRRVVPRVETNTIYNINIGLR